MIILNYFRSFVLWLVLPPKEIIFDPSRWRLFFEYRESPSYYKITIPSKSVITRLPTFGFEQSGKFSVKFSSKVSSGSDISGLNFVLAEQKPDFHFSVHKFCKVGSRFNSSGFIKFDMFANNSIIPEPTKPIIKSINNTKKANAVVSLITNNNIKLNDDTKNSVNDPNVKELEKFNHTKNNSANLIQILQWNGTILKQGVYSPYIIDCSASSSSFVSLTRFENPTIFDFRERGTYSTLKGLSILYPSITILYIINGLSFPQFYVDMHHYLTFIPIFKAGVLILEAELYGNKYVDPVDVAWSLTASVVLHSVFTTVLLMIAAGWCTYEEEMQMRDVIIYITLPATMLISSALSNYSVLFTYLEDVSIISFAVLVASMYTRIIRKLKASRASIARAERSLNEAYNDNNEENENDEINDNDYNTIESTAIINDDSNVDDPNNIQEDEESDSDAHCDPNYVKKLEMVLRFMNCCAINILTFFLLSEIAMFLNAWAFIRMLIIELGILNIFIIEMCFFFYRADHAPVPVNFGQNYIRNNEDHKEKENSKSRFTKLIKRKIAILIEPKSKHMFCLHAPH